MSDMYMYRTIGCESQKLQGWLLCMYRTIGYELNNATLSNMTQNYAQDKKKLLYIATRHGI